MDPRFSYGVFKGHYLRETCICNRAETHSALSGIGMLTVTASGVDQIAVPMLAVLDARCKTSRTNTLSKVPGLVRSRDVTRSSSSSMMSSETGLNLEVPLNTWEFHE